MGRKAQNRIKVVLQIEEGNYQSLAVNAHAKGKTVSEYLEETFNPKTPEIPLFEAGKGTDLTLGLKPATQEPAAPTPQQEDHTSPKKKR